MTNPHTLFPSTLSSKPSAGARSRVQRASGLILCVLGLLGATACSDSTGNDVIESSPRSGADDDERSTRGNTTPAAVDRDTSDPDGPVRAVGSTGADDDESGIDDEDDISARSGGARSTGGGGGRRRTNTDDDDETLSDAGIDAGEVDGGVIEVDGGVDDAGIVDDAGVVDAG